LPKGNLANAGQCKFLQDIDKRLRATKCREFLGQKIGGLIGRVARFFLVQNTKTGGKYTKLPQNIPNGHKIFPIAVKYTKWS
jgi:hypothetical protein